MKIAPEGRPFIALGWSLTALAWWAAWRGGWSVGWSVVAAVLSLLAIWLVVFFRDPTRDGPRGDAVVIAPADGKVVGVVEADEPMYLKTRALRVSIFMSVFDVHVNRYPVSGTIELAHYNPGKFLHAAREKASLDNEQASVGLRGRRGPVLVRQIAGSIARRIVTDGKVGDAVTQGARLGMIRFGSRVDVFLPVTARAAVRVRPGDRVAAGATVLAEYGS
ncbi:MAG: phosphatidylserine decarboxylase family protein [Gemmatimonadetes bacterium]|nr:MAG: phosphatidylserine decarboxylase family protein [Gemmatimonadota bacterium]